MKANLEDDLKKHFNHDHFLQGQKEIIKDVLKGNNVLGILPTSSGKSLCYQLPAKLMNGTTVVISPLVSLMLDQVQQLKAIQYKDVAALNSLISWQDRQFILNNLSNYSLIYVSPELLQNKTVINYFKRISVSLFVIDEAHCISQWGHEFRPDYLKLPEIIKMFNHPPVLALSATAPEKVQKDIVHSLHLQAVQKHIYPIDRPNIALVIEKVGTEKEKNEQMIDLLHSYRVPTLIYFLSRNKSEEIAQLLKELLPDKQIAYYHGGMDRFDRITIQQQFMNDELDIICCTSAFGMGINKKNIRLIIHYHLPVEIESFIQEIGRAGRDQKESVSVLFYNEKDIFHSLNIIEQQLPNEHQLNLFLNKLYGSHIKGESLPVNTTDLEQFFQMDDVKIRFFLYQLEKYRIIDENKVSYYNQKKWNTIRLKINQFMNERFNEKQKKLIEMINWLQTETCLRESLYLSFQQSFQQPEGQCCSSCHFSFKKWNPEEINIKQIDELSWQMKLTNLLQVGDHDETV